jgi:hypothetical protein
MHISRRRNSNAREDIIQGHIRETSNGSNAEVGGHTRVEPVDEGLVGTKTAYFYRIVPGVVTAAVELYRE